MRSGRARMKGYNDDTNSSSDREESFNNEESKDEKQGMSSPSDATSTTTVNKAKGGDLKVIKLADDAAAKEGANTTNTNNSNEIPPIEPIGDLTEATIRITSNKFKGFTGIITERRTYQHAFIECDQQQQLIIDPVHISDIEIVTHPPKSAESELTTTAAADVPEKKKEKMDIESSQEIMAQEIVAVKEKYIGAKVRIVKHHKDKDVVGTVKKIIYGDYYITDNPYIKGAVRKGYEVLEYPPGFNDMRDSIEEEEKLKEVAATDDDDEKMDDSKTDEKSSKNLEEVAEENNMKPSSTNSSGDEKSSENLEEVVEENNKKSTSTDPSGEDAKANDKQEEEEEEEEGSNVIQVVPPIAAAAAASFSTISSPSIPNRKQNLIGATIRIKKGRYTGLVGVINERQKIRRIQLDSLPLPVKFDDIEVIEFADNRNLPKKVDNNDKFAQYIGAKVKVKEGTDQGAGTVGIVTKVICLGDWYITDNKSIPSAFPQTKFDIIKYPPGYEQEGVGIKDDDSVVLIDSAEDKMEVDDDDDGQDNDTKEEKGGREAKRDYTETRKRKRLPKDLTLRDDIINVDDDIDMEEEVQQEDEIAETDLLPDRRQITSGGMIYRQQQGADISQERTAGQCLPKVQDNELALDPILLQQLPKGLRSLPSNTKIEVFNRRTGKIMKGNKAILLKDLPRELIDHAEYEPIVPPLSSGKNTSITSRVGRSGHNIHINRDIIPQTRVRASTIEGRRVLVTGGEYKGLSGKIDSCIPGGYYILKLFKDDSHNVLINASDLELLPEKKVATSTSDAKSTSNWESLRLRIHMKAAKLRLDSYSEEGKRLSQLQDKTKAKQRQEKLDNEINKTMKVVENIQRRLSQLG